MKYKLLIIGLLLIRLIFPQAALGSSNFIVDSYVKYDFQENGDVNIIHNITLENQIASLYAKSYTISFKNINPQNVNVVDDHNNYYLFTRSDDGDKTVIKTEFPDDLVGKGLSRIFYIKYSSNVFANKYGEIFEVNIPKLSEPENFRNYEAEISIAKGLGKKAYISPVPIKEGETDTKFVYYFNKSQLASSIISAAFGDFQVFDFSLNFHLENPESKTGETEIALPPDTSYQRVYYDSLDPRPLEIAADNNGNWLAKYILRPKDKMDITAKGSIKIFSKGISLPINDPDYLNQNLLPTEYWQVNDPAINRLGKELKTPKQIYRYVVNKLNYNYEKITQNSKRLGAVQALENPDNANCREFTDLFIALSRAAGIPAREINGYAYTDNPKIEPLSLIADVLHAWPEYWDDSKKMWIPVDPTWEKTTGGEDFFNKLDLRHFSFVIHGSDDTSPYPPGSYKLGDNPKRDIFISYGKLPDSKLPVFNLSVLSNKNIYYPGKKIKIKIENKNGYSINNELLYVYYDGIEKYQYQVQKMLPFSSEIKEIDFPFGFLGKHSPKEITITFLQNDYKISGVKTISIIISLLFIFGLLSLIIITYWLITKKEVFIKFLKKPVY